MPWWCWLLFGFVLACMPSLVVVYVLVRRAPYVSTASDEYEPLLSKRYEWLEDLVNRPF